MAHRCLISGCNRPGHYLHGSGRICTAHYARKQQAAAGLLRRGAWDDPIGEHDRGRVAREPSQCVVDGCGRMTVHSGGLCGLHYNRRLNGQSLYGPTDHRWADSWFPKESGRRLGRWLSIRKEFRVLENRCRACGGRGRVRIVESTKNGRTYFHTECVCNACSRKRGVRGKQAVAIFERDSWLCWICGRLTDIAAAQYSGLFPTLDHVVPVNRGGGDEPENLRCCCFRCNIWKSDRLYPDETGPLPLESLEEIYVSNS